MKILMRADTHVNIELPGNAPVAKCTFTQVSTIDIVNLYRMYIEMYVRSCLRQVSYVSVRFLFPRLFSSTRSFVYFSRAS